MYRPFFTIAINPNLEADDIRLAQRLQHDPTADDGPALITAFRRDYRTKAVFLFNAGRSALMTAAAAWLSPGDEVLLPAYTCIANLNSIRWARAKPVLVDTEKDFPNLDPADLETKITARSRAVVIQHTYGRPARMPALLALARRHHLLVIEDCCHTFNSRYDGRKVGTFGDAAFFSFGRDKALSSVFGGILIVNRKSLIEPVNHLYHALPLPASAWVRKLLFYPPAAEMIRRHYRLLTIGRRPLGKALFWLYQQSGLLLYPVSHSEKIGVQPVAYPARMAPAQSVLAWHQYQKLGRYTAVRCGLTARWSQALPSAASRFYWTEKETVWLRLPFWTEYPDRLIGCCRKKGLELGDWYRPAVAPSGADPGLSGWSADHFPNAFRFSRQAVNLPVCPRNTVPETDQMIMIFKECYA